VTQVTAAPRYHLVADDDLWRRNRVWLLYPAVLLIGFAILGVVTRHVVDPTLLALAAILIVAGGVIYWRRTTRYVTLVADGLLLHAGWRRCVLGFGELRRARTQTLGSLYDSPSRRGHLPTTLRRYSTRPVLVVRVDQDGAGLGDAARVLGRRIVLERDLILLVEGAGRLEQALAPSIPRRPPAASGRGARPPRPARRRPA